AAPAGARPDRCRPRNLSTISTEKRVRGIQDIYFASEQEPFHEGRFCFPFRVQPLGQREDARRLPPSDAGAIRRRAGAGWSSVRFTVWHIVVVTEGWLRTLANEPDQDTPPESEVATPDAAAAVLDRAYRILDSLLPTLTAGILATPRTISRRG